MVSEAIGGRDQDTTRIAAQIVTGIGFLGAGAILRERQNVVGLTTAATIWAVAAVGMAAGFGRIGLAAFGTGAILLPLFFFSSIEDLIGDRRDIQQYAVAVTNRDDARDRLHALFAQHRLRIRKENFYEEGSLLVIELVVMGHKTAHDRLRFALARSPEYTLRKP
jgi:putative Mg2+ transporter-C (MgtC) family protein